MNDAPAPGRGLPGPERMAGGLSAIVILVVVFAIVAPTAGSPGPAATPRAPSALPGTPQPTLGVDAAVIETARAVNRRLAEGESSLSVELQVISLDIPAVQGILRGMNPHLRLGVDIAARLRSSDVSRELGDRLARFYEGVRATVEETLQASIRNEAAYRAGAVAILARLGELPDLNGALAALLAATPPPATPVTSTPGSSASAGPPPTPTASPSAGITASPAPPSATPSTAGGTNQLTNGGFEGSVAPWQVDIASGAVAAWTLDTSDPAAGASSLRVTIAASSLSRAGISVRQLGVSVLPGVLYRLSVRVRAEASRELRLSVESTSRVTYASTLGVAGIGWTDVALEFLAIAGDEHAVVAIDLGRDTATTWLDDVAFATVTP